MGFEFKNSVQILPAIDLFEGECVRLRQGDFGQVTVYSKKPQEIVAGFERSGFGHLHMVDLSGARDPSKRQISLIRNLVTGSQIKFQVGGGIRSLSEVRSLLDLGVDRVVLGSIAVHDPDLTLKTLREFGSSKITLALDVLVIPNETTEMAFYVATQGWMKTKGITLEQALEPYLTAGVKRVLCTDISRDGMLEGPNFDLYRRMVQKFPSIEFQASGGVRGKADFPLLADTGVHSVVVGKAFYENLIRPEELC